MSTQGLPGVDAVQDVDRADLVWRFCVTRRIDSDTAVGERDGRSGAHGEDAGRLPAADDRGGRPAADELLARGRTAGGTHS